MACLATYSCTITSATSNITLDYATTTWSTTTAAAPPPRIA